MLSLVVFNGLSIKKELTMALSKIYEADCNTGWVPGDPDCGGFEHCFDCRDFS